MLMQILFFSPQNRGLHLLLRVLNHVGGHILTLRLCLTEHKGNVARHFNLPPPFDVLWSSHHHYFHMAPSSYSGSKSGLTFSFMWLHLKINGLVFLLWVSWTVILSPSINRRDDNIKNETCTSFFKRLMLIKIWCSIQMMMTSKLD